MAQHDDRSQEPTSEMIEPAAAQIRTPLPTGALRRTCDPASLPFRSTAEIEPLIGVMGQDVAMDALRFGLEINAPGQNIFVRGLTGTGRMTLVRRLLTEIKLRCPSAKDRCYVHNFSQPDRPRLITLPRGRAPGFRRRIDDIVAFLKEDLGKLLNTPSVEAQRKILDDRTRHQIETLVKPFEDSLRDAGLALMNLQVGNTAQAAMLPIVDGKPVPPDEWEQLRSSGKISNEQAAAYQERVASFQPQLRDVMVRVNEMHRKHSEEARSIREVAIRSALSDIMKQVRAEFPGSDVATYLDEFIEDVATEFGTSREGAENMRRYQVNVLITHPTDERCAIELENMPTINCLLGSIDSRPEHNTPVRSDHMMICAGALLRADGGYLILDVRDLLREPRSWQSLVRTLRTGLLEIIPPDISFPWWSPHLKPEPIKVDVKVVLLGDAQMYYLLDAHDPDFPHLFKVLADFGSEIPRDDISIRKYGGVLARIVEDESLLAFDDTAIAALVDHGSRISGRQTHLSTRFGRLADIAREASFRAGKEDRQVVVSGDVGEAIRQAKIRGELPSRRFRELLANGTIQIATRGRQVGQINGLAVTHAGPLTYGFPARITASIGPGSAGVINIEGEANLSGAAHNKGFYILGGLLRNLLRTEHPLTFRASIALEQSYGGIDGDSASCAETCCLLSALTEIPIRQDLAITGAIDQMGNIMAIGAANEKIEGFYDTCRDAGLTGNQGVIIPQANADHLMLREDVVRTCGDGKFHVYTVSNVHEALEILTGIRAGIRDENGDYEANTFLGVAVIKAFEYWIRAVQGLDAFTAQETPGDRNGNTATPT